MPPRPLCPAPLVPLALVVSLAVILAAPSVEAQPAGGKTVRIGRLKSFAIESRFADGQLDRLPALAAELVDQRVDLLLTGSNPGAMAAKKATSSIPIVMVTTGDPVAFGLITSLPRPCANLTGVTALGETLNAKRLELLKEAVPGVTRVAVLSHTGTPYAVDFQRDRSAISRRLGLELPFFETESVGAMDGAFAAIAAERAAALMVLVDRSSSRIGGRSSPSRPRAACPRYTASRSSSRTAGSCSTGRAS